MLAACSGDLTARDGTAAGTVQPGLPEAGETPAPGAVGAPFAARMQRLTATQYRSVIAQVLGAGIVVPDLEADSRIAGFDELGATRVSTSARGVELYAAAGEFIAKQFLGDAARVQGVMGCTPTSAASADDACAGKLLDGVGRRLFRRPLDSAERARYLAIAADGATVTGSFWAGLETMLAGLLKSPLFLYRTEWNEGTPGATVRVSGYNMAGRLSFGLRGSSPDDELLDAAARGDLERDAGVKEQAARLLSSQLGQQNLENFFSMMLRLPNGASAEAMAMKQETLLVLQELNAQKAPFADIYAAPFTFINDTLAELYGLPDRPGAALTKVLLPASGPRRGLLGHAGILSESGAQPSAILRGKYIREALLCQVVPPPPPSVIPVLPAQDASKPQTTRERLTKHRADPACASCHQLMDPLGLALENFDGAGKYRLDDKGLPIDPSGELDGTAFVDAAGLGAALSTHPDANGCLVATLHRRLTGQYNEVEQAPTLDRIRDGYVQNRQSFDELVLSVVGAETFLQATLPAD